MMRHAAMLLAAASLAVPGITAAQDAPELVHAFTITAEIGEAVDVGRTVRGPRRFIPITGGTVEGDGIDARVVPGAWDWQIDRPDGCTDLEADYFIETDDGAMINVVNRATICRAEDGSMLPVYTRPVFEPPMGEYQWLGQGAFVGQLGLATDLPVPAVRITVYRVE